VFPRWIIQELVNTPATVDHYQNLAVIFREAQQYGLQPDQVKSRVRETPFASLVDLLPRDPAELYALLAVLLTIAQLVVSLRTTTPTITPGQVEEIIERVLEDHNERNLPPAIIPPAPLTPPRSPVDCK
jgi:hypothetical protein